jgi:fibrillarin-like pre-rRNA processing protein
MNLEQIFPGVWKLDNNILTKSLAPGKKVYGERTVKINGIEYRVWNPYRSKLGAAIKNGLKLWAFKKGGTVLYLGVAEGTTASHIADAMEEGVIFGVDVAPRVMPKLLKVSENWKLILPILADANKPEEYKEYIDAVGGKVDVIYEDVAHPDQTKILIKNAKMYLKPGGYAYYAVKARSIDVTKDPKIIFREEREKLERAGFEVLQEIDLEPYEKDHVMFVLRWGPRKRKLKG